jgi:hypothetical protein
MLREWTRKYGNAEGRDKMHEFAINQGFSMDGNAIVSGVKWVKGEVQSDGVLVQGMNAADPFQFSFFGNDGSVIHKV